MNPVLDKIWVNNLNCNDCVLDIQQALMNMIGVLEVRANPNEGWVEIEHEDFTDLASIIARLAEVGYPIEDADVPLQMGEKSQTIEEEIPQQWIV